MDQRGSLNQRQLLSETLCWHSEYGGVKQGYQVLFIHREGRVKYFNNMHSYSQYVLMSWGYTTDPPPNYMQFV